MHRTGIYSLISGTINSAVVLRIGSFGSFARSFLIISNYNSTYLQCHLNFIFPSVCARVKIFHLHFWHSAVHLENVISFLVLCVAHRYLEQFSSYFFLSIPYLVINIWSPLAEILSHSLYALSVSSRTADCIY